MKRPQDSPQRIIARRIIDAFKDDSTHKRAANVEEALIDVIEVSLMAAEKTGYINGIKDAKAVYDEVLDPKGLPS
jgi:hypothetical protein